MKYGLMYELTSRIRIIITTRTYTWIVLFNLQIAFRYSLTSDHYKKNTLWNQHYYNPHHVDEEADRQDEAELKSLRTITLNNVSFVSITIRRVIFFCNNVTDVYKRHRKWFSTVYKRHKKMTATYFQILYFYMIYEFNGTLRKSALFAKDKMSSRWSSINTFGVVLVGPVDM